MQNFASGWVQGLGATLNIQLGWIPDYVTFFNVTDGVPNLAAFPSRLKISFTSGSGEIKVGHTLKGATSKATAVVMGVLLASGTWAAGTAAGTLVLDANTYSGTFESENLYFVGSTTTNDLQTAAAPTQSGYQAASAVATATSLSAYLGTEAANSKGFTAASGIATNAKVFIWNAWRNVSV